MKAANTQTQVSKTVPGFSTRRSARMTSQLQKLDGAPTHALTIYTYDAGFRQG